ncbi:hypothetical protein C2S52_006325 [Perilla frutescens var. hirtella]|nr:hypothetical protein C2S52_006325 [Perilla frutescens var. hirtella]
MLPDLQVDVNGQETFSVSMKILASFSGKLKKMFGKPALNNKVSLKLVFQDFPGGAEGFELILRFCYNGGRIGITPSNVVLLHSAAKYLEINQDQTTKHCESVHFLTWSEILDCLKQCQEFISFMNSSRIVQEILNAAVEKISMPNVSSPFAFSCSDFSGTQFSGDVSTNCSRSSSFQTINWLRDLEFLNTYLFEKVINTMISQKLDHGVVFSFLLHYQRVKFIGFLPADNKCKITEVVISSLCSLDGGFRLFPFRSLCDMLRACLTLKMGKCWVKKVERMIGLRLDEATLDDLLIPSHGRKANWAYDVNMILRFLKIFLGERREKLFIPRLRRVGFLMDLYLAEVAPDPHLKPLKFLALGLALPDSARESYDSFCEVISMYLKVHKLLSEEEKIRICSVLNADKLSSESLVNLANNVEFPACVAAAALVILQSNLKTLSKDEKNVEFKWSSSISADEGEQIVVHLSEGRECRKVLKVSSDTTKMIATCQKSAKSLPRLCS